MKLNYNCVRDILFYEKSPTLNEEFIRGLFAMSDVVKQTINDVTNIQQTIFNRDNITLAIALFGALGTVISGILNFIHSRKRFSLQIVKICYLKEYIVVYIAIQNKSRLPISINDISLIIGKEKYTGNSIPPHSLRYIDPTTDIPTDREHFTIQFPLNLGALAGASGYMRLDVPEEVSQKLPTHLIFQVATNRGNSVQKKLERGKWTDWQSMI